MMEVIFTSLYLLLDAFLTELNIINNKLLAFFVGVCGRYFQ